MTILLPAFIMGLAGSLHCIGMCSPLVMSISGAGKNAFLRNLQYNFGRIITYGFLGCIFSFVGQGLQFTGLQSVVSGTLGVAFIALAITQAPVALPAFLRNPISRLTLTLKDIFAQILYSRSTFGVITLGMINGILPCGMTLIALGYCVTLPSPQDGLLAMIFFGIGTLPGTAGFAAVSRTLVLRLGVRFSKLKSALMIGCAVILIGRAIWTSEHLTDHSAAGRDAAVCGGISTR